MENLNSQQAKYAYYYIQGFIAAVIEELKGSETDLAERFEMHEEQLVRDLFYVGEILNRIADHCYIELQCDPGSFAYEVAEELGKIVGKIAASNEELEHDWADELDLNMMARKYFPSWFENERYQEYIDGMSIVAHAPGPDDPSKHMVCVKCMPSTQKYFTKTNAPETLIGFMKDSILKKMVLGKFCLTKDDIKSLHEGWDLRALCRDSTVDYDSFMKSPTQKETIRILETAHKYQRDVFGAE